MNSSMNTSNHMPADYYSEPSDDDYDCDYDYEPPRVMAPTVVTLKSPPEKLTLPELDNSTSDVSNGEQQQHQQPTAHTNLFKYDNSNPGKVTTTTTLKKNNNHEDNHELMTSFQMGDPISMSKQVRHLHNRVRLLEGELQTQNNRQVFLIGIVSAYLISKGISWISH